MNETDSPKIEEVFAKIRIDRTDETQGFVYVESDKAIDLGALRDLLAKAKLRHHGISRLATTNAARVTLYGPRQIDDEHLAAVIGVVRRLSRNAPSGRGNR